MHSHDQSPLQFPCDFPIKAMGHASPELEARVLEIVRHHAPDLTEGAVQTRASHQGNYVSITVTVRAESRAQLDAIYRELTACPQVLIAL